MPVSIVNHANSMPVNTSENGEQSPTLTLIQSIQPCSDSLEHTQNTSRLSDSESETFVSCSGRGSSMSKESIINIGSGADNNASNNTTTTSSILKSSTPSHLLSLSPTKNISMPTDKRPSPLQLSNLSNQTEKSYDNLTFESSDAHLLILPKSKSSKEPNQIVIKSPRNHTMAFREKLVHSPREKRPRLSDETRSTLYEAIAPIVTSKPSDLMALPETKTPISPTKRTEEEPNDLTEPPHSLTLWGYLLLELASQKNDVFIEEKTEHLLNIIEIPLHLEKVIIFGTLTCLDSFLHFFTVLPLRFFHALYILFRNLIEKKRYRIPLSRKADIIKGLIFLTVSTLLLQLDTSRIYHNIRGQAAMKLYVMFNVLEIADKLFSALGQDILECLFSFETLNRHYSDGVFKYFRPVSFVILAIVYVYFHSLVIMYQIISLNVAVNSYSNALLTLLLSNQFSEIKSSVFKKFERENLFQHTCADITERFQLIAMLFIIGMRNIVEISKAGLVPKSWLGWNRWLGALFGPMLVVVGSEICVDWLKHAYISKFNNIRPKVYRKFLDVLTYDYSEHALSDYNMTKRIGIPIFPIASVFFRILLQSYTMLTENQDQSSSTFSAASSVSQPALVTNIILNSTEVQTIPSSTINSTNSIFHPWQCFLIVINMTKSALSFIPTVSINADSFFSYVLLILVIIIVFGLLFVLKLTLGLFLLEYSSNRRAKLLARTQQPTIPKSNLSHRGSASGQSVPMTISVSAPEAKISKTPVSSRHSRTKDAPQLSAKNEQMKGYESDGESDFIPGPLKGGQGLVEIPEHLRERLYAPEDPVPPVKPRKSKMRDYRDLLSVTRFKMTAKQIW